MAETKLQKLTSASFLVLMFTILFSLTLATAKSHQFSRIISRETLGLKEETLSHFHFYLHDVVSGPSPSAVRVAAAPTTNSSATGFGAVVMMDNRLTVGPEFDSELVGKAQGIYAFASQTEMSVLMVLNFVFNQGKYNGSTLSVLGRNSILATLREMPIVGGSGVFRFARGYAQAQTYFFDPNTGDANVEYNVYVFHY